MGSYANFKINEYNFFSMKSYVDSSIISLFTEEDREETIEHDEDNSEYEYKNIIYQSDVKTIKIRLNIMGFNLKTLEYYFSKSKKYKLDNFDEEYEDIDKKSFSTFLNDFTFDEYLTTLKEIYDKKIYFFNSSNSQPKKEYLSTCGFPKDMISSEELETLKNKNPYIKYTLEEMEYPDERIDIDYRFYLRGFLEKVNEDINIFVDVSEIINAGYYDEKDKIAEQSLAKEDKVIIFTEGKYDTEVIKKSMELLYPQYSKYFSFLDIELSNLELGANRIITYLKSFISAGIVNKVIVLFDNDAEENFCKNELLKLKNIPNNFCIKTYPDIEIAKNYPTICPTGTEKLNINGSACSIEVYLCENILKKESEYIPVQWKSFNENVEKYQGSFSKKNKGAIQKQYNKILIECFSDKSKVSNYNFENMKILLEDIFESFNEKIL